MIQYAVIIPGPVQNASFLQALFLCLILYPFQSPLIRRPAVSVTGREKRMDFALLSIPAFSMMDFMKAPSFRIYYKRDENERKGARIL